jgi:hypothetical protein
MLATIPPGAAHWFVEIVRQAGPTAAILVVLSVLTIAMWRYVGKPMFDAWGNISANTREAAVANEKAAEMNKAAAASNLAQSEAMRSGLTMVQQLITQVSAIRSRE